MNTNLLLSLAIICEVNGMVYRAWLGRLEMTFHVSPFTYYARDVAKWEPLERKYDIPNCRIHLDTNI